MEETNELHWNGSLTGTMNLTPGVRGRSRSGRSDNPYVLESGVKPV